MAEDIDVEAMLEAPYKKDNDTQAQQASSEKGKDGEKGRRDRGDRDRESGRRRSRSRDRDRERRSPPDRRDRDRRDRDRDRPYRRDDRGERYRERDRDRFGRDRERDRRRDYDDRRRRSPPRRGGGGGGGGPGGEEGPRAGGEWPGRKIEMTPEERDARTVFVWQLSARIRPRDLEDFFSSVGAISDVRLIMDNKTRRSKGIAYVEFRDVESVQLALALTGTKLLNVPIQVQSSQAEKNRVGQPPSVLGSLGVEKSGPLKLYVGSLHYNINEEMLMGIFEPFGKIDELKIMRDPSSNVSMGYGFVTYHTAEEAKKALEQLNGFELAGRPMKVGHVVDKAMEDEALTMTNLDNEEMDKTGVDLGTTGRLALMAKLAEGTGMSIPTAAKNALEAHKNQQEVGVSAAAADVATPCFMLSNMFDPNAAAGNWEDELSEDVIEECNKHGGVLHLYVDKDSPQGNVYVKCPTINCAAQCVNNLHGRWFSKRVITAAYVPLPSYHQLFPAAAKATTLIGANPPKQSYTGW